MTFHATAMVVLHLLFAGVWAGAVVFTTYGVLPTVGAGGTDPAALSSLLDRLRTVSRASAVALLLTGGAMAGEGYGGGRLFGTVDGWLVLGMLGLWVVLAALVEVGTARAEAELATAGRVAGGPVRILQAASGVGMVLLVIGGVLSV